MLFNQYSTSRRAFLKQAAPLAGAALCPSVISDLLAGPKPLLTRGVVLAVEDLETLDWPKLAKNAGLTTIGTHVTPSQVAAFIASDKGQQFLTDCKKYKIQVEHELHSMKDLLPRNLFEKYPEMFRMNSEGVRVNDYNCCPHSAAALEIITANAVKYGELLTPTTTRFFYWIDDAVPMCHCPQCKDYSDSDQALLIENAVVKALRRKFSGATLAHLAYVNTLTPPTKVKPEEGIFLEFAPIYRRWDRPLSDREAGKEAPKQGNGGLFTHGQTLDLLYQNLEVFPARTAQVLEYWLDVSLQSKWKKPAAKIEWHPDVCRQDLEIYRKAGINHVTSFAVYIDGTYKSAWHDLDFINEYGKILRKA